MLNLNCVICSDLFNPSDDVHITTCGHMFHLVCLKQWIERSKTCPQCRNKCSERNIIRVYFNIANLDVSQIDIGSMQEQLDNAQLQIQSKDREVRKSLDEIRNLRDSQKKCMKTISGLEKKLESKSFLIDSYDQQLKVLQTNNKILESLREENRAQKAQLEMLKGASSIITSSVEDAEKILNSERDIHKLAVWGSTLKRELQECNHKKNHIHKILVGVKENLRKETDAKQKLEKKIEELEDAIFNMTEKIKTLESKKSNDNIKNNSNNNFSATFCNTHDKHTLQSAFNDVNKVVFSPLLTDERRSTISPTIKKSVQTIEESNSPYLNIKSSSIGLMPLFKPPPTNPTKSANVPLSIQRVSSFKISPVKVNINAAAGTLRKASSDISETYSILKKPRFGSSANAASQATMRLMGPLVPNQVPNGFGGTERADPFARNLELEDVQNSPHESILLKKPTTLSQRLKAGKLRQFRLDKK